MSKVFAHGTILLRRRGFMMNVLRATAFCMRLFQRKNTNQERCTAMSFEVAFYDVLLQFNLSYRNVNTLPNHTDSLIWCKKVERITYRYEQKRCVCFTSTGIRGLNDSTTQTLNMKSSLTVSNRYIFQVESILDWFVSGLRVSFDSNHRKYWCQFFVLPYALRCRAND